MDTNLPNPTILAIVTIHEWQTFTKQCNSHPVASPEFPSLTIKVEGRSLDLYLGGDGQEPENIGILYTETYSEQTATELEEAIKKGLLCMASAQVGHRGSKRKVVFGSGCSCYAVFRS